DPAVLRHYLAELEPDAAALGVQPGRPDWTDDDWDAKLAALLARPPAVVSFTFGCPEPAVIAALQAAGSLVWVTVTTPDEAALAASHGADGLGVQGPEAAAPPAGVSAAPGRAFLRRRGRGGAGPAAAAAAGRRRGGHQPPPGRRGGDHERSGRGQRAGQRSGRGPVRHGLPALPGERGTPAAQGGPRRPAVHRYRGHPGVHR